MASPALTAALASVPVAAAVAWATLRSAESRTSDVESSAPRDVAARLERLERSLDAGMRAHAGLALAVASLRIPETGIAALRRVADRETDPKVAEKDRQAAAALQSGTATLKSLERLFE